MDAALLARGICGSVKGERQWGGNVLKVFSLAKQLTAMQESLDEWRGSFDV